MELTPLNHSEGPRRSLLQEIAYHRTREYRRVNCDDDDYVLVTSAKLWLELFINHFVNNDDVTHDDLLFFVRKTQIKGYKFIAKFETDIDVFRHDSKKLPIGNLDIDWEETLYLNVIMQRFEYHLTCAVCSRTSPNHMQILRKQSQRVYASPSHRPMNGKGDSEHITYPNIFFSVDNFEEILPAITVRDGEIVCVELVASDKETGHSQVALFCGTVQYEALKRVYYVKSCAKKNTKSKNDPSLYYNDEQLVFVNLKGPRDKGYAELAVTKVKNSGLASTPSIEAGYPEVGGDWEELEDESHSSRRRMSDPSSSLTGTVRGWQSRRIQKSRSETQVQDGSADGTIEIECADVHDELNSPSTRSLWSLPGFCQTFHFWKENKRINSLPLHSAMTYVTLPWHHLIADFINSKQKPILTF